MLRCHRLAAGATPRIFRLATSERDCMACLATVVQPRYIRPIRLRPSSSQSVLAHHCTTEPLWRAAFFPSSQWALVPLWAACYSPPLNENAWETLERALAANLDGSGQKALSDTENTNTATRRRAPGLRAAGGTYCGNLTVAAQLRRAAAAWLWAVSISWLWWRI